MKSLTAVRKKSPNYPVEFKIKMVELSHRPEISVAQLAREHGINDNLLFKWRQYWREGKLRPPSTTENNVDPITIRDKDLAGRWHHRYEKRLQRPGGKGADDAERRSDVRSRFYLPWA